MRAERRAQTRPSRKGPVPLVSGWDGSESIPVFSSHGTLVEPPPWLGSHRDCAGTARCWRKPLGQGVDGWILPYWHVHLLCHYLVAVLGTVPVRLDMLVPLFLLDVSGPYGESPGLARFGAWRLVFPQSVGHGSEDSAEVSLTEAP